MNLPPRAEAPRSLVMQNLFATFVWSAITAMMFSQLDIVCSRSGVGWTSVGGLRRPKFIDHPMFEDPEHPRTSSRFTQTGSNCTWSKCMTVWLIPTHIVHITSYYHTHIESVGLLGSQLVWPVSRIGAGLCVLLQPYVQSAPFFWDLQSSKKFLPVVIDQRIPQNWMMLMMAN